MEKKIREYEKFAESQIKKGVSEKFISYHREMLRNFQHERLVHLIIMLFFITITLVMTFVCLWIIASVQMDGILSYLPAGVATLVLWILSIAYVKHYYFLENHIQSMYDISKRLFEEKK